MNQAQWLEFTAECLCDDEVWFVEGNFEFIMRRMTHWLAEFRFGSALALAAARRHQHHSLCI